MVRRARRDGLSAAVMSEVSGDAVRGFLACLFPCLIVAMRATCAVSVDLATHRLFVGFAHERVLRHQGRPSASSQRQHASSVTKRIVNTAAHIAGTTDVSTPAGVALYATAASRLRPPMFQALPAFHVQCSSLTPAGVVWSSLRRAAAGEGAAAHDLQPGEVIGACRSGRRRWGARSAVRRRGDVFLGACRRGRGR